MTNPCKKAWLIHMDLSWIQNIRALERDTLAILVVVVQERIQFYDHNVP